MLKYLIYLLLISINNLIVVDNLHVVQLSLELQVTVAQLEFFALLRRLADNSLRQPGYLSNVEAKTRRAGASAQLVEIDEFVLGVVDSVVHPADVNLTSPFLVQIFVL